MSAEQLPVGNWFSNSDRQEYQAATANPEDPRFINKVSAGPLVDEVDDYMIGSFFLVAATREEAQKFVDNDPFKKARTALKVCRL